MTAAGRHGTIVSYDLNYRPSLWKAIGGARRAQEVNRRLAQDVNVILGSEEDFTACLGLEVEGTDDSLSTLPAEGFTAMIEQAAAAYPNFQVIATTLRAVKSATVNDWSAIAWSRSEGFAESTRRPGLEILDRVGGGDSFAAGLIFGLLTDLGSTRRRIRRRTRRARHDDPGDTSTARKEEVDNLVAAAGARADRWPARQMQRAIRPVRN
jgi:2-dehydro-3-deoxygluconokinase